VSLFAADSPTSGEDAASTGRPSIQGRAGGAALLRLPGQAGAGLSGSRARPESHGRASAKLGHAIGASAVMIHDPGPSLTPAEAAALHDRPDGVAWFAIPAPGSAGVIARAHTEAHDGGQLLPGHLAARGLAGLHAMMPRRA